MPSGSPLIVALDFPDADSAWALASRLDPHQCRVKVGFQLFVAAGPDLVARLVEGGFGVFLDLKFHDIPNTVRAAVSAAARLGVWMLNVHASGGRPMLEAAMEAVAPLKSPPKVVAVTVLTSLGEAELAQIGVSGSPQDQVLRLARLSQAAGLDGVVCSAREAALLRKALGGRFVLVTPGIRPSGDSIQDQRRVMTPAAAVSAGADYLVVGRPITQAEDPRARVGAILSEIQSGRSDR